MLVCCCDLDDILPGSKPGPPPCLPVDEEDEPGRDGDATRLVGCAEGDLDAVRFLECCESWCDAYRSLRLSAILRGEKKRKSEKELIWAVLAVYVEEISPGLQRVA